MERNGGMERRREAEWRGRGMEESKREKDRLDGEVQSLVVGWGSRR